MKKIMAFLFLMLSGTLYSQVSVGWVKDTAGISIALDSLNNVYTIYYEYNPAGDIYLIKRNSQGIYQWQTKFENTDNTRFEAATWVATDRLGNIIVTGTSYSGYSNPVAAASIVMKFSPTGQLLWRRVYESSFDGSYTRRCLVDEANNIYVLGMGSGGTGFVTKVKKFDPDGNTIWNYFDSYGIGAAVNFKFTPDNAILIIGRGMFGSINGFSKITQQGNALWGKAGILSLTTGDASGDSEGNTYLINGNNSPTAATLLTRLNENGNTVWEVPLSLSANKVVTGKDKNPVASGYVSTGGGGTAMAKTDRNGSLLWLNNDADGRNDLLLHAQLIMDEYDNIYLAAGTLVKMAVCKVNANGTNAWTRLTRGAYSNAITIGTDYNVYIAGGGATAQFVQPRPCLAPSTLFTSAITNSRATLSWETVANATGYLLSGRQKGTIVWRRTSVTAPDTSFIISGLNCNTEYEWRIRANCVDSIESPFSPITTFNTTACLVTKNSEISRGPVNTRLSIFPNPASGLITLIHPFNNVEKIDVRIYDINNRLVLQQTILNNQVDISKLPDGIYILMCIQNNQTVSSSLNIMK